MIGKTILVADDEPHLLQIVAYNIKKLGATVHVASNGRECADLALSLKPDLIVSDYQMPVLNGLHSCIEIKLNPATKNIPVIMLTARGHRLTEEELAQTGIVAVLAKPFSARQLLAKIEQILSAGTASEKAA